MAMDLTKLHTGPEVDRACYTDPAIFALETERIFERAWLCVAHESEFKQPGDFRTSEIAGQPVIAIMGKDRQIRVLYNSCRHRGSTLSEDPEGNCAELRCPYHHWTYGLAGELISVPRVEGFGKGFRQQDHGLRPVAKQVTYFGLIFASLNESAEAFQDYIGPAREYLDYVLTYDGKNQTVIGYFDYSFKANWKLLVENTMDDYHAEYLHGGAFAQRVSLFDMPDATTGGGAVEGTRHPMQLGIHGGLQQQEHAHTLRYQQHRPRRTYIGVFPSLMALYHPVWDVTGLRLVRPVAVDRTQVLTYCIGPADASDERRRGMAERFNFSWGPGGRVGVDDVAILERVQHGLAARRGGPVMFTRGVHRGSGDIGEAADEHSVRGLWNGWRRYMLGEPAAVASARTLKSNT